ncbi:hypothetical protein [Fibrella forsythiae]|uniref:Uncharacterized protein n=1 Tax=Fibrella forsythiae TaxID=2817061 RepID=A0ABS3JDX7_9BACT|nr:hypothetical protein [Fibrella forsythiae]MBO0947474.1 hypothetical protein [Fibrella forsythiae]
MNSTVIKPGSRVSVRTTNKYDETKIYTATAVKWKASGLLEIEPDEPQANGKKTKSVSANNVKLIKQ